MSAPKAIARDKQNTWAPFAIAACIVLVVMGGLVLMRVLDGGSPSTPSRTAANFAAELQAGDQDAMQAESCDGWPTVKDDLAPFGDIKKAFLLDGPTVKGGSATATIGIGDGTLTTTPPATVSADTNDLLAHYVVTVGLSHQDGRWCVASFTPTSK